MHNGENVFFMIEKPQLNVWSASDGSNSVLALKYVRESKSASPNATSILFNSVHFMNVYMSTTMTSKGWIFTESVTEDDVYAIFYSTKCGDRRGLDAKTDGDLMGGAYCAAIVYDYYELGEGLHGVGAKSGKHFFFQSM